MKTLAFVTCLLIALTAAQAQTVNNPVPLVNTPLVPAAITPGSRSFVLTVNGNGFTPASLVHWNGSGRQTTFVSNTQVTARISAAEVAVASTAVVTVSNPVRHISNPVLFHITTPEQSIALQARRTPFVGFASAADVNGDGNADLLVAQLLADGSGDLLIVLGNGDGTFRKPEVIPLFTRPSSIIFGDFFHTGRTDIAMLAGGVEILHNQGGGVFGSPQLVNGNVGNGFNSLATADLDADGQLDLVGTGTAANGLGYVYVMLRTPDGHFHLPVKYQTGKAPLSVAIGDFNRDGIADLATLNFNDNSVSILLGNGDGTFQPEIEYPTGNPRDFPDTLVVADFNGDGNLDLARGANVFTAGTGILLGNGDGTFQAVHDFRPR